MFPLPEISVGLMHDAVIVCQDACINSYRGKFDKENRKPNHSVRGDTFVDAGKGGSRSRMSYADVIAITTKVLIKLVLDMANPQVRLRHTFCICVEVVLLI